jgi:hypothetical protein
MVKRSDPWRWRRMLVKVAEIQWKYWTLFPSCCLSIDTRALCRTDSMTPERYVEQIAWPVDHIAHCELCRLCLCFSLEWGEQGDGDWAFSLTCRILSLFTCLHVVRHSWIKNNNKSLSSDISLESSAPLFSLTEELIAVNSAVVSFNKPLCLFQFVARGSVVGRGVMLQVGRSRVRTPMR